jgi:Tol biopolymer transport system component
MRTLHAAMPSNNDDPRPVWLPDGKSVAFTMQAVPAPPSVWIITAGAAPLELIKSASNAVWSRNGARVAFTSRRVE